MTGFQRNRFLGIFYMVFGLVIIFFVAWELLFKLLAVVVGLFLVFRGLGLQGYPASRLFIMSQQWRSRF